MYAITIVSAAVRNSGRLSTATKRGERLGRLSNHGRAFCGSRLIGIVRETRSPRGMTLFPLPVHKVAVVGRSMVLDRPNTRPAYVGSLIARATDAISNSPSRLSRDTNPRPESSADRMRLSASSSDSPGLIDMGSRPVLTSDGRADAVDLPLDCTGELAR